MQLSSTRIPPLLPAQRLATLLATYDAVFAAMLARDGALEPAQLDPVFTQLRLTQRQHWPEGAVHIAALGLAACDLLQADAAGSDGSAAFAQALREHANAVVRTRAALQAGGVR